MLTIQELSDFTMKTRVVATFMTRGASIPYTDALDQVLAVAVADKYLTDKEAVSMHQIAMELGPVDSINLYVYCSKATA